jgi:cytochrome oxidase assembly protein ShyY1
MSRYRFALSVKWIVSHVFVLFLVVVMINLGFWQLRRLDEKQALNSRIRARSAEPVAPVDRLVGPDAGKDAVAALEYRKVTATGTYRADQEVLVRYRSLEGAPGSWVLTPLQLDDGRAVVVNRGWIGNNGRLEAVPDAFRAPSGPVTVTGLVQLPETRGSIGTKDPKAVTLTNLARADIARLDAQVPEDLLPLYVQLTKQAPAVQRGSDPRLLAEPALDEGPHLSYAVQWFLFTSIVLVGYPLILRRRAREVEVEAAEAELDRPDPDDAPQADDPRLDAVDRP